MNIHFWKYSSPLLDAETVKTEDMLYDVPSLPVCNVTFYRTLIVIYLLVEGIRGYRTV